jgi:prepilin-type N-terminal cleavage/methylation domain-containing protein
MLKSKAGFTLIELLVVIAIIAILAAILFPVFATAKEKGRMITCTSNLKELSMAMKLYADNNGGKLPMSYPFAYTGQTEKDWCGWYAPADATGIDLTKGAIWPYCGRNKKMFLCPTDANLMTTSPNMRFAKSRNCADSYAMNWRLGWAVDRPACDTVPRQAQILLLIHEGRDQIDDGCFCWWKDNTSLNLPTKVHYNGSTLVYLDCHAVWRSYNALIKEQNTRQWDPTLQAPDVL